MKKLSTTARLTSCAMTAALGVLFMFAAGMVPAGRLGSPEEIAEAVAFFAEEKNSYLTGQILGVNGGFVV